MIHGKIAAKACDIRPKDARDERPLNLAGRFLCPTDDKGLIAKFWAKSTLLVKGRTTEATQVKASDMLKIMDPSAVPSTNMDEPVRGALKYTQIGRQAAGRLLEGLLEACLHTGLYIHLTSLPHHCCHGL